MVVRFDDKVLVFAVQSLLSREIVKAGACCSTHSQSNELIDRLD